MFRRKSCLNVGPKGAATAGVAQTRDGCQQCAVLKADVGLVLWREGWVSRSCITSPRLMPSREASPAVAARGKQGGRAGIVAGQSQP